MTFKSLCAGVIAAVLTLFALMLIVAALNKPLDGVGLIVIAVMACAVGGVSARRSQQRHG